jgi:Xaa-Pro aminopeptidase
VNGKFTNEQRQVYEIVLASQSAGMEVAKPNSSRAEATKAMRDVITRGLLKLGLITEEQPGPAQDQQVSTWYTHGPIHGIGVDVHDPLGQTFVPGSAFVMEPGLYIRLQALEDLLNPPQGRGGGPRVEPTPAVRAFVEKVRPMVIKYKDIGVRIEDSFLMTEKGLERLSTKAPRTIEEIEKVVGTGK